MRVERRADHTLVVGGPVPPGADAWTLGRVVIVRKRAAGSQLLLAHELEHVQQFAERGAIRFLARYLLDYLRLRLRRYGHRNAYLRIPAEIEADWRSRRAMGVGCIPIPAART